MSTPADRQRRSAWIATAQIATLYAGSTLLTPLYHLYRQKFGFSALTLTLIYSAYVLGNLTALLPLGRLSDQVGRRVVSLGALLIGGCATLLLLFASSAAWLFAGRIVSGLAIGLGATATTAWLAELVPDKRAATVYATQGNYLGLALGAVPAGFAASYLPWPLRLSYVLYLLALSIAACALARLPETVSHALRSGERLALRPRLGVPRKLLGEFLAPAAIAFAAFAVIGYYAALIPSIMAQALSRPEPVAGGAVMGVLSASGIAAGLLSRGLSNRTAMLTGSALLLPALVLLPCAEALHSYALLLCGTVIAGAATMLGYRGSLEVVNEIAPQERRAEIIASFILCMYAGNSVPIIGIGLLGTITSSFIADLSFALVVALVSVLALFTGARRLSRAS